MQDNSGKLPRAWFDIAILTMAAVAAAGFGAYRFWPIGCSNSAITEPAKEIVRRELKADRVTFHLVEKISRMKSQLNCVATARIEFDVRDSEYHDVVYQAQIDDARHVADVKATLKPAGP